MSAPVLDSNPPRGHFGVWQRLLRGYGPLAVFALMILLLSVLVPSKVHDDDTVSADQSGATAGADGGLSTGELLPTFTVSVLGEPTGGTFTLAATLDEDRPGDRAAGVQRRRGRPRHRDRGAVQRGRQPGHGHRGRALHRLLRRRQGPQGDRAGRRAEPAHRRDQPRPRRVPRRRRQLHRRDHRRWHHRGRRHHGRRRDGGGRSQAGVPRPRGAGAERSVLAPVRELLRQQRRRHVEGRHRRPRSRWPTGCSTSGASSRRWPTSPAPPSSTPRPPSPRRSARWRTTSTRPSSSTAARSRSPSTTGRAPTRPSCSAADGTRPRPTPSRWPRRSAPSPTCPPRPSPTPARSPSGTSSASARPYLSRAWHEQRAPYAWSLATDGSIVSELAGEYAVKRLYGKPAAYAGGDGGDGQPLKDRPRKHRHAGARELLVPGVRRERPGGRSARAAQQPGFNRKYVLDLATMSDQATGIIAQMKDQNVTTMLCGCDPIIPVFLSGVASREQLLPRVHHRGHRAHRRRHRGPALEPGVRGTRVRRQLAQRLRAAHPHDRLPGLQVRAGRRAGVLGRPHLLPDVHAGDRAPGRRAEPHARPPSSRACSPTRRSSGPSGCGSSARATAPRPTTSARSTGTRTPSRPTTARAGRTSARATSAGSRARSRRATPASRSVIACDRSPRPLGRPVQRAQLAIALPLLAAVVAIVYNAPGSGDYLADKAPWGIVVAGIIIGTVTALLAMGLILIYRTNRFINFGYGSMGSFAGVIAIGLYMEQGVNFFVALADRRGHRRRHRRAGGHDRPALPHVVAPDPHRRQHRHRPDAGHR